MSPATSTRLVIAGAAITLGSRPTRTQRKGIIDPSVEATIDTNGNVKNKTVATWKLTPNILYAMGLTMVPSMVPDMIPAAASFQITRGASLFANKIKYNGKKRRKKENK